MEMVNICKVQNGRVAQSISAPITQRNTPVITERTGPLTLIRETESLNQPDIYDRAPSQTLSHDSHYKSHV